MPEDLDTRAPLDKKRITILVLAILTAIETLALIFLLVTTSKVRALASLNQSQIDERVAAARQTLQASFDSEVDTEVQAQLQEKRKTYTASDYYGAFTFDHPKFWYVFTKDFRSSLEQLRIYIDPNELVDVQNKKLFAAFRVIIKNANYDQTFDNLNRDNNVRVRNRLKISNIVVSGISGKLIYGKIEASDQEAKTIMLPYRDKTMYIITDDYKKKLPDGQTREKLFDSLVKTFNLRK